MNWIKNEIVRVTTSVNGTPTGGAATFRIVEVAADKVVAVPAFEEKMQEGATAFLKKVGYLIGQNLSTDMARFHFDPATGDQIEPLSRTPIRYKIHKIDGL